MGGFLSGFMAILLIFIIVLLILTSCIKIVPQAQALVVERLGAYLDTWSVGVHFKTFPGSRGKKGEFKGAGG